MVPDGVVALVPYGIVSVGAHGYYIYFPSEGFREALVTALVVRNSSYTWSFESTFIIHTFMIHTPPKKGQGAADQRPGHRKPEPLHNIVGHMYRCTRSETILS